MLRLEQRPPSYLEQLPDHLVAQFGADLLTQIQTPPQGEDPDEARRRLAEMLVAAAGGDRKLLEQLRSRFIHRLHLVSDDFAATAGLRATEGALALLPRSAAV
jgi:hypothetical protein